MIRIISEVNPRTITSPRTGNIPSVDCGGGGGDCGGGDGGGGDGGGGGGAAGAHGDDVGAT